MTQGDDLEMLEELVNKGISLQREGKHKEAIVTFDKAISLDENMNGQADLNLLLLKENSSMKL
jgi:tetratricopeptide (TPR) repeat protein